MKKILVFLFLLYTSWLHAQSIPNFQLFTTADGLSQGMVLDILQSRDGFIWMATKDGLNRFDGSRFKVYSPNPFAPFAIGGSVVQDLFEDSRGWIWISQPENLDVLDPVSGRFFHLMHEGKPIGNSYGAGFMETPDGVLWLMDNDRIWKVSPPKDMLVNAGRQGVANIELPWKAISMSTVSGWSGGPLRAKQLYYSQEKKLLVCTNHGLFRLDPATEQIVPELPIPDYDIQSLTESKSGEFLVKVRQGGRGYLTLISNGKVLYKIEDSPRGSLSNFVFDDAGCFWAYNSSNKSIQKWRPSMLFNNGMPELEIPASALRLDKNDGYGCTVSMVDKSGNVWVGTSGYGVVKINETGQKFKTALPRTAHVFFYEDPNGALYTGSIPDKKFLFNTFDHSAPNTDLPMLKDRENSCFTFDPAGNTWWLNRGQICRASAGTKTISTFPFEGFALICDQNGRLVSVNEKGLHRFDPATETSQHFPFEKVQKRLSENSRFLYEDAEGVIWIFGLEGLIRATPSQEGYHFELYLNNPANLSSLSINTVLSVADDPLEPRRYLWVGTKGGGLNRLEKQSGKFKKFGTEQGLPDNVVYGILSSLSPNPASKDREAYIWLSTNKGLCRFDVRAESSKNFTIADGLQDNEFNSGSYFKTRDGYFIYGGINGINIFHPDSLHFNKNLPQTHIVGLQVNNQKMEMDKLANADGTNPPTSRFHEIILDYNQNLLNFEFAALEFTNPAQNQYRYQLVGVDKDWVSLGNKNSIQFANLAPGSYTFKVLGSNNDGAWSEQPAELRFTIRPPWWASWWAYGLYFLLVAAGVWWYYQYLLRQRFSEQEKLRLKELDDFKSRFFTNITHEFRTPLTVMLGMSDQLAREEKDEPKRHKIGLIKRSGERLLLLANQILDLAKLESNTLKMNYIQGDVLAFIRYIAESLHSLANAQNLILRVESDQAKIVMDYDPERLLQIVHNLLSNAIKFTPSGGKVALRVHREGSWLHLSVTDTGVGIPPEELPHLFERFFQAKNQEHAKAGGTGIGLSLTRELVRVMGGEITVESTLGQGSTFLVKLPVTNSSLFEEKMVEIPKILTANRLPAALSTNPESDKYHILLIEDNPDVVEYLNTCLKDQYHLDFAYNGQAGIEKAFESVPDLIVSDVMMPFKDGFEVVEALKNDERTSHIPIVLLTAKADVQSRLTGLRKGADAYLSKPFHQEELLVMADNLLETRQKLQLKYQQQILAPETPSAPAAAVEMEDAFLQKVRAVIEAHYPEEDFGLPQLCQKIGMSRSQLFRKMKALTDIAPSDLIRKHRLNKAKTLLESGAANVAEAAWQVGFKDPSYFSKLFQEEFGAAPSTTRK